MLAILSLLVVLILSILVTRIATVALTYTGLSRESAKFQARSAFTGVGFTTDESEKAVNHPVRRRILMALMLLGNAGVVTAVSTLIVSFINASRSNTLPTKMVILVAGLVALWALANSSWVDRRLHRLIAKGLKRYTNLIVQDYSGLLHLAGDYQIIELMVRGGDWLAEKSIAELGLKEEGIIVLGVNRPNGDYLGVPDGQTIIHKDDTLLLYGRAPVIQELDQRGAGSAGNSKHRQKVEVQQQIKQEEKNQDDSNDKQ
jgi:hypothetical protein